MAFRPLILLPPLAFAALAVAFWVGMQKGDQPLPSMTVGQPAPPIRVAPLRTGKTPITTADFVATLPPSDADLRKPGVKLLNFWASWCEPCRAEHPMLEKLQAEGVVIYGINYKDKPEDALKFLADMGSPYARLGADAGPMALDWGVYGVPETYVIDGKGQVILRLAGPITADNLESMVRPAMAKATAN